MKKRDLRTFHFVLRFVKQCLPSHITISLPCTSWGKARTICQTLIDRLRKGEKEYTIVRQSEKCVFIIL